MKLTLAQHCLLVDASDDGGTFCVSNYRPARRLVSLGLAFWEDGSPSSERLNITKQGRAMLSTASTAGKGIGNE